MSGWRRWVYDASRSRSFLWRFAIVTLLAGCGIGAVLSELKPAASVALADRVLAAIAVRHDDEEDEGKTPEPAPRLLEALAKELADPSIRFQQLLAAVPVLAPYLDPAQQPVVGEILRDRFPANQATLAADFFAAWKDAKNGAFERIAAAATASPQPYAHYVLGRLELRRQNHRAAYEQFREEALAGHDRASGYFAVQALTETGDYDALVRLAAEPAFAPFFDANTQLKIAIKKKDWRGILKWVPRSQLDSYGDRVFAVSLVAGLAWAVFLLNLGEIPRLLSTRTGLCAAGFLSGILSTTLTVYLGVLEDDILKYHQGESLYQAVPYYIAGVGLREEVSKLLLFVPFLPFLLKRDDELEALLLASFVGLGFAIEENAGYFMLSEAAGAPGRFLTANFFHVALTGLNGLALFRACARYRGGLNHFMAIFPLTFVVHGAYDALIDSDELDGGPFWAMVIYVVFCRYYFTSFHPLRSEGRRTLSLTGSLVFGVAVLGATVIAFQMATLGAREGATLIFPELLGNAVLLFFFFREVREPLTR